MALVFIWDSMRNSKSQVWPYSALFVSNYTHWSWKSERLKYFKSCYICIFFNFKQFEICNFLSNLTPVPIVKKYSAWRMDSSNPGQRSRCSCNSHAACRHSGQEENCAWGGDVKQVLRIFSVVFYLTFLILKLFVKQRWKGMFGHHPIKNLHYETQDSHLFYLPSSAQKG